MVFLSCFPGALGFSEIIGYSPNMKNTEYTEGPKAKEKFEHTMTALFQVKKAELAKKIKAKLKKGKD
jgi:hypothetical protein